jgi:hypothetical protein
VLLVGILEKVAGLTKQLPRPVALAGGFGSALILLRLVSLVSRQEGLQQLAGLYEPWFSLKAGRQEGRNSEKG